MKSLMRSAWSLLALAAWLAALEPAPAAPPEVKDDAGFFSSAAVSEANAGIRELKQSFKKDLHVETFQSVPANLAEQFKKDKNKAFLDWAQSQAAKNKIDGVYVLVCKEPAHFEVYVDTTTLKKALTPKDRDKLRDQLLAHFRNKEFDKGLKDAVVLVRERFQQNLGPLPVQAVNKVQDNAGFFSSNAVTQASKDIKEFQQRFQRDMVIETFPMPPPDKKQLLENATTEAKNKIFSAWLHERLAALKFDGIYILICREPARIQIEATPGIMQKVFTAKDRDQLVALLVTRFKAKEYDKALDETLDQIYDTVDRNLSPPQPAPASGTIKDHAQLFTDETVQKAARALKDLHDFDQQTVSVETWARVPPGQVKHVEAMSPEAKDKFFTDWLKDRARAAKADGIFVLVCKQPARIQVGLGDAIQQKAFTLENRAQLHSILQSNFKDKQIDLGLLKSMTYIAAAVAKNTGTLAIADNAGLFKTDTFVAANRDLRALRQKQNIAIKVETFASLPAEKKEALANLEPDDDKGRRQVFADWQAERVKATGSPAIHVLINKESPRLEIAVDEATQKNLTDWPMLRDLLATQVKDNADQALLQIAPFVRDSLAARAIQDEGGFFSPEALTKGNAAIRALRRRFQLDLLLETFREVTAERAKGVDLKDVTARGKLFAAWAGERQKTLSSGGISILICRDPRALQVATDAATNTGVFPAAERDQLVKILITNFRSENFDTGLAESLAFVEKTLKKNQAARVMQGFGGTAGISFAMIDADEQQPTVQNSAAPNVAVAAPVEKKTEPTPANATHPTLANVGMDPMWLVWGLGGLVGLWLIIGILRAIFGGSRQAPNQPREQPPASYNTGARPPIAGAPNNGYRYPPANQPLQQGGGGGGFVPSLLGGLFGGAAGSWIYDRMAGGGAPNYPRTAPPLQYPQPSVNRTAPPSTGGRYAGSGGDFGEATPSQPGYSSAGGDFGTPEAPSSSGGDFDSASQEPASSGGDFDQAANTGGSSSGGDFGSQDNGAGTSGGDFAAQEPPSTGGDFASDQPASNDAGSVGGDFGGGGPAADAGGGSTGADFGGGGGGDSGGGGGGGGDFS